MSLLRSIFIVSSVLIIALAIYIKSVESYHSHWRFLATNWSFRAYVFVYKILIFVGIKTKEYDCSVELQLMDDIFRTYIKPDYTNHNLSTANKLLLQTRQGRKGFLKITMPPIWDSKNNQMHYETITNTKVLWVNKHKAINNGIIISFHGGAYVSGSADSCLPYLLPLTKYTNLSGLSVEYSISPEVLLPQQIDEAFKIYKYLLTEMKISSDKIIFAGDSAGGSLIILLIQKLIQMNANKNIDDKDKLPLPLCGVTMSSWDVPSNGDSYQTNRDMDSLMDDKTGQVWGYFAVGNVNYDGDIIEKDKDRFDRNMNDNKLASYLHKDNLWTFKEFPPMFLSASEWECVLDDSLRVKQEMDKYKDEDNVNQCIVHVTKNTGIHVLEDFAAHGIVEAEALLQTEAKFILQQIQN